MLSHQQSNKVFGLDKDKGIIFSLLKYPEIDHYYTYLQEVTSSYWTSILSFASPTHLFLVSYSYYPHNIEDYNEWKSKVINLGYRVHIEKCKYSDIDAHMILIADKDVNIEKAIEFIHQNPHPRTRVIFS